MPLVRISLIKGRPPETVRAIAEGVHQALVETYNVPPDDNFQIIEQLEPDGLIYDAGYVGVHRTDAVVFIHIFAGRWRDTPKKKALYKRLAELLAARANLRPEDVQVVISSNEREDWSFGKGLASYLTEDAS